MNLQDLRRKLIRLSGGTLTRGAVAFEAEHPAPRPREFAGLRVMVENPAGSTRSGVSRAGKAWSVRMRHDYGFLPRAKGADGEGLDVFLNTTPCRCDGNHENVYVVHQNDPETGKYDEDKVMLGFHNPDEAKAAYLANYDRPEFFRSMTILPMATFRGMLTNGTPGGVAWKRKHGREHTAAAMFAAGEGRWVTIGSDKSAPKGEKGGTPVYIGKDGTIEAGPQKLEGRNVSNLKEPAKQKEQAPPAAKVQPLTSQQLHERVKQLRGEGKSIDLAVAQARRESQQQSPPAPQQPEEFRGGPHAEIEARYGPKKTEQPKDTAADEAEALKPEDDEPVTVIPATEGGAGETIPPPSAEEPPAAAAPAVEKKPEAKPSRTRGEPAAIPPQELRRRILERYEQENGRGIPEEAWDLVNGMQDPWTFARGDGLKGDRNTMLREGGKEGAAIARSGAVKVAARGGGEDALNALKDHYGPEGEDLYWRMAKARAGSGFDDALAYARKHDDPQVRFLAALHDITPSRKQDRVPQESVSADRLPVDHEFKVQGVQVKVTENEDGERVLVDHGAIPETPVDALDKVPVDKGTLKETELPDVGGAGDDPFGDLPPEEEPAAASPPAEPEEQPVAQATDAGDGEQDQTGDELGEDAGPAAHAESVPAGAPSSDTGVFGQEILRNATGNRQEGLFHEPVQIERPESERVGSKNANDPRHTAKLFPSAA